MHRILIENTLEFEYGMEFSLLDSIEAQSLDIDYNCRAGFCGSCKADLLSGKVEYIQQPDPVSPLQEGEILTCCCRPSADVELRFKNQLRKMTW
jgi:ferredoxin